MTDRLTTPPGELPRQAPCRVCGCPLQTVWFQKADDGGVIAYCIDHAPLRKQPPAGRREEECRVPDQ